MTVAPPIRVADRRVGIAAWCLFDWANSPFGTVIETFIFSVYFATAVYGSQDAGASAWAFAIGISGLVVAVLSPVLGAIADHTGRLKPWILVLTLLTATLSGLLWFVEPDESFVIYALVVAGAGTVCFELTLVFYNALLPAIAPPAYLGRISGWAWGLGYVGGLACLVVALVGLVGLDSAGGFLGVPTEGAMHIRATALLVAVWMVLFAVPMFLLTRDEAPTGVTASQAVRRGLRQLRRTLTEIRRYGNIVRFLIASAIYRDGLATLFAVGGIFAGTEMGMSFQEILIFAIGLNVTAGLGAAGFATLDDRIGSKRTILLALIGLMAAGVPLLMATSIEVFIALALVLGIFIGPAQAASRSLMARLAPPGMETEMFGLYSLTGKSIAFIGPLMFSLVTQLSGSQRIGMLVIVVLFLVGGVLLLSVRDPHPRGAEGDTA
ncbi:MAG: MFS transporter [Azospirillaceae bacterium]